MDVIDKIKRIISLIMGSEEWIPEKYRRLLSQCDAKLSELSENLALAQDQNKELQLSLDKKVAEINDLRDSISDFEKKIKEQADVLSKVKLMNDDLRHNNLNLQEENELHVGRSSNVVSKLMNFCELLKTMNISSVEDCITIIKNEIKQSTTEMGFEIIESYEGEFNPETQSIVDTQFTDDNNLNNHIAKVVRPGVWYDNKCLIPQDVIVYTINQ